MNTADAKEQHKNDVQDKLDKNCAHASGLNTSERMALVMNAAKYGQINVLQELLRTAEIDVNARDEYEDTALIIAARNGRTGIVKELLQVAGIEVNARRSHGGKTALIHAAKNGKIEMVRVLLSVPGIDLDVIDKYGKSALMYAEEESHAEIAHMLQKALSARC